MQETVSTQPATQTTEVDSHDEVQHLLADPPPQVLTKVTANLIPRALSALNGAAGATGDNRTDVINRSLQVYAYIVTAVNDGKLIFLEDPTSGARERLVIL